MTPLTPAQIEYKTQTLAYLLEYLPQLKAALPQESPLLREQISAVETHIARLEQELAGNRVIEPVADELFTRAAGAIARQKFSLAKKYLNKLALIEPFYPELERLQQEAETGRASRRTRSVVAQPPVIIAHPVGEATSYPYTVDAEAVEKKGMARFFQFHIVLSCLLVLLVACVMMGIGGVTILRFLVEGS
jgi:hypothetical protein